MYFMLGSAIYFLEQAAQMERFLPKTWRSNGKVLCHSFPSLLLQSQSNIFTATVDMKMFEFHNFRFFSKEVFMQKYFRALDGSPKTIPETACLTYSWPQVQLLISTANKASFNSLALACGIFLAVCQRPCNSLRRCPPNVLTTLKATPNP